MAEEHVSTEPLFWGFLLTTRSNQSWLLNEWVWLEDKPGHLRSCIPSQAGEHQGLFQQALLESRYYEWALHSNTFGQWRHQRTLLLPIVSSRINPCFLQRFPPPAAGPAQSGELCRGTKGLSIEQGSNCGFLLSKRLLISDAEPCKTRFRKWRKSDIVLLKQRREGGGGNPSPCSCNERGLMFLKLPMAEF